MYKSRKNRSYNVILLYVCIFVAQIRWIHPPCHFLKYRSLQFPYFNNRIPALSSCVMKISAIIPTYKPQGYLWQSLDALSEQTLPKEDFEVLLILNGCQHPYEKEILEYIDKHRNKIQIKFIQTETPGVSNARNMGLDAASGEYITFIDDDDLVSPQYLEELYAKAAPDVISLCYPKAFTTDIQSPLKYNKSRIFEKHHLRDIEPFYNERTIFSGAWMKLIHRDIIGSRRFPLNFKIGEDCLFMFLISDRMKKVRYTSDAAIYYRRFRVGSAIMSQRSVYFYITNFLRMIAFYSRIYFRHPLRYNFYFYSTRVLGGLKTIAVEVRKTISPNKNEL